MQRPKIMAHNDDSSLMILMPMKSLQKRFHEEQSERKICNFYEGSSQNIVFLTWEGVVHLTHERAKFLQRYCSRNETGSFVEYEYSVQLNFSGS